MGFRTLRVVPVALCLACAAGAAPIKLIFGAPTGETPRTQFLDFAYVTPETKLEAGGAWGWTDTKRVTGWVYANDRLCSTPCDGLVQHCVTCWSGTLSIRVPNGPVAVHLWVGDAFQGIRRTMASYRVKAEGKPVVEEAVTFPTIATERWWLRGESEVYRKNVDRWVRQVKPILDEYDFTVEVTDGQLDLAMENVNLSALVALPTAEAEGLKAILAAVETERRKQFEQRYPWKPKPDEPMPPVAPKDQQRGFVVFQKLIDDQVYPWTRPAREEVGDTIRVFAAAGEQEPFRFGILPLRDLRGVSVEVGNFAGPGGAAIDAAACGDLWTERYTERGSGSTGAQGSDLDPACDVLLQRGPTDYEPGLPRMFTYDLRVPAEARPGYYRAPVVFRGAGGELGRAELLLRVLPWGLPPCPVPYTFQSTYQAWTDLVREGLDPAAVRRAKEARVRFTGKYGFSMSYFHPMDGWGHITGQPGERHFEQTPAEAAEMDWWYQLAMNEGNARNYWIQYHWPGSFWIRARWQPGLDYRTDGTGSISETDRADLVRCIREFEAIVKQKGYPKHYWYASGEPDNFGLKGVERGNEMAQIVRDAGGATLCSLNGPIGNKLAPPVHDIVLANHATPITEEFIARVKGLGHQFGAHNTGDSRLSAGYQFWRLGAVTKFQEVILYVAYTVPYTYLPWNYKAGAAYPMSDGGWRPTVRWLRYRDGRDDYVYLTVLEQRLAKAREAGLQDRPAVEEAAELVSELREKIYLDPAKYFGGAVDAKEAGSSVAVGWSAKRFARYRWLVAGQIMAVDEVLAHGK